jgi:hypothetical protein
LTDNYYNHHFQMFLKNQKIPYSPVREFMR